MASRKRKQLPNDDRKDLRWWLSDQPHAAIWDLTDRIDRHLRKRQSAYLGYACLYDDSELAALIGGYSAFTSAIPDALSVNVVRRQVDAYVARIAKNRPVPFALTNGGNYGAQQRAKKLTKFFEGVLESVGYYEQRSQRLRDSALWGSGFAHNFRIGRKLYHERVFPWELAVDPREAIKGRPRSLYKTTLIDRLVLAERFPDFEEEIMACASSNPHALFDLGDDGTSDLALVREAWHLPSGEDMQKSDGAHVIAISNATLQHREYARDYFPFSRNTFSPGVVGWFGEGLVKGLEGVQAEINDVAITLQESRYGTGTYVWVPDGSGIEVDALDNDTLSVIRSALEPKFLTPNFTNPQLFQYFEMLRTRMPAEITGISGMSTRGEIPQGLESGKAIRTYHQIDSEQFVTQGREDERDCIDTAWQLFDLMEEIHEETKGDKKAKPYVVRVEKRTMGRSALESFDYAKVRMDRESFTLRTFPTNFLATTPEDKWSQVQDMAKSALFPKEDIAMLMDAPDIQHVMDQSNADRRVIEKIIETILEAESPKPIYPEPTMNLDLCVAVGTRAYLIAKWIDEAPETHTSVLLDFILGAKDLRDGTGGPQAGTQDPNMPSEDGAPPVNQPGMDPTTYVAPEGAPLPAGAVAPDVMPAMGQ